ncbi:MAG: hypothetical protein CVV21_08850 [Candidatus Goldiibacteriota bacterium HGW-Goldbacteria-1]|jgi:invasion protein IalB|nr:MAG: hypothetical protein CVV21_08850 [Candidatus Goldiibacteriota bacterium HGW-Goldbacteria-1]
MLHIYYLPLEVQFQTIKNLSKNKQTVKKQAKYFHIVKIQLLLPLNYRVKKGMVIATDNGRIV